jgi:ribonuclease HII
MKKTKWIAGVDEAGRGPLAGPVVAAAVILPSKWSLPGLTDSKKLTAIQRDVLFDLIHEQAISVSVGRADVSEIDSLNILHATLLAMQRAISGLSLLPHEALIDGNRCPVLSCPARAIIGGDLSELVISAASIIAKVTRDREMIELATQYPGYGLEANKGYTTDRHLTALKKLGPTVIHRRTFAPVAKFFIEEEVLA